MKVSIEELKSATNKALRKSGYDEAQSQTILEVLMYAQLRGNNQGVVKLTGLGMPNKAEGDITVVKETSVSAWLDAHQNHAMVAVNQATGIVIDKAKASGIAIVGVKGIGSSSGALGYYARRIARAGLVGMVFAGSMETVAPAGSYEPLFGTNPFAVAVPGEVEPLTLDMATAAMAYYGLIEAKIEGRPLPKNVAYDKEGKSTTDANKALDGALLTFDKGGHKGSGLSMIVQLLTGPLTGAYFAGNGDSVNNWGGHLIIAFDPNLLGGLDDLKKGVEYLKQKVKATKKLPGVNEIFTPSEHGDRQAVAVIETGEAEIEDNLWMQLNEAAK